MLNKEIEMRQHYIPEPARGNGRIRSVLLAVAIGVGLAAVLVY